MPYQAKEVDLGDYRSFFDKREAHKLIGPANVILQVNYGCYLKCEMCDRHTWTENNAPVDRVLTNDDLSGLFLSLASLNTGRITLVGTEPVLRPDLEDLLTKINQAGIKPELYTAGIVLKDNIIAAILANQVDVSFSIDGFKSDSHNRIRYPEGGFDAFGKSMNSIKRLAAARDRDGVSKKDVRITGNMTLQRGNIDDLNDATEDMIESLGVDTLRISIVHGDGSYALDRSTIPKIVAFVHKVEKMNTKTRIILSPTINFLASGQITPDDFDKNVLIPSSVIQGSPKVNCHISEFSATIDPQGNVYPCLYLYDDNGPYQDNSRQQFVVGNIKEQSFGNIWNGEKYNQFRSQNYPDISEGSRCRTCEYIQQFIDMDIRIKSNQSGKIKVGW